MKTSAYVIEIEQSEKETGKTMHNTRHEIAKLITQNERLQQENQQLKKSIKLFTDDLANITNRALQLEKQKDDVVKYIKNNFIERDVFYSKVWLKKKKDDLLRMLGEIDEI